VDPSGLYSTNSFLTTTGGFFRGLGNGLTNAAVGLGQTLKTAGQGWGDMAYAVYGGALTEDPWLTANTAVDACRRFGDTLAQDYRALSEDPWLALDVAVDGINDWLLKKLCSPEGIGELTADAFLALAPFSKGIIGEGASGKIGRFLTKDNGYADVDKLFGSGRNEQHGRMAGEKIQSQLDRAKQQLEELKNTQGSKRAKTQLENKINNLKKEMDRAKKGETHHRRGQ
jgi:hypothetical protein